MAKKISLEEFGRHWNRGEGMKSMSSVFESNVENFITRAGAWSRSRFASSFEIGGFYGSGTKWKPRESKWGKKFTHPIMIDTETLKRSIKGTSSRLRPVGLQHRGFRSKFSYDISTNEKSSPFNSEKRGRSRAKGYAAIHNTDPKISGYTVNQHSSRSPEHRQFIGHSPKLDDYINTQFLPKIFDNIPNDKG